MSTTTDAQQPADDLPQTSEDARPRRVWFPWVWIGLLGGACLIFQFSGADQDVKNFSCIVAVVAGMIGLTIWLLFGSSFSWRVRWGVGLAPWMGILVFSSMIELINNGDIGVVGWRWRQAPKPDETLQLPDAASTSNGPLVIEDWQPTSNDYPRFLGNGYWAEIHNVRLETDWKAHPPQELWRRKIGAGWSGFSLVGSYAVTQEQRGPNELVTCYNLRTGDIVWTHSDPVRFDPNGSGALGGVGPRATPTIHDAKVITQGATGIVNCLDARTGDAIWAHDTLAENKTGNLLWGKSGSPLVVVRENHDDMVVVSVGGAEQRSLVAYHLETGEVIWSAGDRRSSYASPVLTELVGEPQILSINEEFITAHRVDNGAVLWEHPWPGNSDANATIPQPVPLAGDRVFLSKGYGVGSSLLQIERDEQKVFQVRPLWQPAIRPVMKTKMCNVVVRDGFMYGLDGGIMQCIELETGKSRWKKRRRPAVGHGQILLVGDVILILSESGELMLVEASSEKYRELASMRVLKESQVTWNNPAFSPPYLLVRNAEEAACYKLPLVGRPSPADLPQL